MLGKTANGLFWMARYLERAENIARLIETGQRIALTRLGNSDEEWASVLQSAGALHAFRQSNEAVTKAAALNWMLRDSNNPSSILSCIEAARQQARLVRTAITAEVWGAVNATYITSRETLSRDVLERELPGVLQSVRRNTALVRGMISGTMMRDDIYDFLSLGVFLERADNTARILDVKYYVLLPTVGSVGSSIDNVQWESILRSVSASGGFRMKYGAGGGPQDIACFLILDRSMPRSLSFCVSNLVRHLRHLDPPDTPPFPSQQKAAQIETRFLSQDIGAIFEAGLHEYIQDFLGGLNDLAVRIEADYRFTGTAPCN